MTAQFSRQARQDLFEIAAFIAHDNIVRAERYVDRLEAMCGTLAENPGMGVMRPELGAMIRIYPYEKYNIYYTAISSAVRIERIIHSARLIDSDDFSEV